MLVLSRKEGESIRIGDRVEVFVLAISRKKIRIGIEAPTDVNVGRSELVAPPERSDQRRLSYSKTTSEGHPQFHVG